MGNKEELAIIVSARDVATKVLRGVKGEVKDLEKAFGHGLQSAGHNLEQFAVVGAGLAAAGIGAAVKAAGDFEASLHTINTVAQATPEQLDAIGSGIRKLARDTGTELGDLSDAYYDLVSAGISTANAQDVLTAANTLAIGGLATTAQTVDLLTTAINAYGGDATRATEYADDFAKAIELGKVTAADISASFADVGAIAAQNGISVREVAESYAFLTAQGVPAAETTTQMARAILELIQPSTEVAKLQKDLGKNYAALASQKGLVPALQELRTDAEKAGVPLVDLFGRVEGFKFLLETTGPNFAKFGSVTAQFGNDAGTAARQMSERQQGLNFQIRRLKALAIDTAITIGSKLLPKLTPMFEKLAAFVDDHQADISKFGDDLAKAFGDLADYVGKIDWEAVTGGIKLAADAAKGIVDAFLNAPAWVQEFLVGGFALNKFTGGALGDIFGNLAQGLIKGVLGMNAGVVNINAGVVNGAGGVGGAGTVAGAGGVGLVGAAAAVAPAVAYMVTSALADQFNNDPARQQFGITGTMQPIANPFDLPAVINNFGTAVELFQAGVDYLNNPPAPTGPMSGGLSPDDRQILSDQKKATEALGVYEQQAARDEAAANLRNYGGIEALRSETESQGRNAVFATNQVHDALEAKRLEANLHLVVNVATSINSRDVIESTTQTKILAGGIQQI